MSISEAADRPQTCKGPCVLLLMGCSLLNLITMSTFKGSDVNDVERRRERDVKEVAGEGPSFEFPTVDKRWLRNS